MPTAGERFAGQRVLIIGKGNSAFETAQALLSHAAIVHLASPHPVRLAWTSKHPGDVRGPAHWSRIGLCAMPKPRKIQ
ncbi:MAG: NAD(P)-binding domain-containing protein [Actinomycetota bacterium]|nr:NAD(P)-binding domain-containing protein [Actinomycetota bacterium]